MFGWLKRFFKRPAADAGRDMAKRRWALDRVARRLIERLIFGRRSD